MPLRFRLSFMLSSGDVRCGLSAPMPSPSDPEAFYLFLSASPGLLPTREAFVFYIEQ